MKTIEITVLSTRCPKCHHSYSLMEQWVKERNIDARVEIIQDEAAMKKYSVRIAPGIVINGKLKSEGEVPLKGEFFRWIEEEKSK